MRQFFITLFIPTARRMAGINPNFLTILPLIFGLLAGASLEIAGEKMVLADIFLGILYLATLISLILRFSRGIKACSRQDEMTNPGDEKHRLSSSAGMGGIICTFHSPQFNHP
jgi:hypothetical protein